MKRRTPAQHRLRFVAGRHLPSHRRSSRKRVLGVASLVTGIAALATLGTGLTFGLFSASSTGGASDFTAGTVVVGLGTGTAVQCKVSNLAPGDASSGYPAGAGVADRTFAQCRYFVTYTGTVSAYLAVDVAVSSEADDLYTGSATGLQLLVQDSNGTTYVGSAAGQGGTAFTTEGGTAFRTTLQPGATASDLLLSSNSYTGTSFNAQFGSPGDEFTIDYWMPIPSANSNIDGATTITLTFHAVQAGNNTLPAACSANSVSCTTGMIWS